MSESTLLAVDSQTLLTLTTRIVSAYAGNAKLTQTELGDMIGAANIEPEMKELVPAVPVKKSVTPNFVICLEDGKKLKMLKRHLMSRYQMTPDQYRAKWSLPRDYPMVAPNYAASRSALAKKIGLGKSPSSAARRGAQRGRPAKKAA